MNTTLKKITHLSLLLMLALLIQTGSAFAQQGRHRGGQQGNQPGERREKMEAQKIAFITKQLELKPDEAKVFWPVYNEYDAKRLELRKSFKKREDFDKDDIEKLSEKDAAQMLDNQIIEAQKLLDLRKEYHAKFKAVLPAVKVLKLYNSEREFQKILIEKIRQHRPDGEGRK